jgi:hypothetical protein
MKNIQTDRWLSFEDNGIIFNNSPSEFESFLYFIRRENSNIFAPLLSGEIVYLCSQKFEQFLEATADGVKIISKPNKNCEFRLLDFRSSGNGKVSSISVYFLQHVATGKYLSAEFDLLSNETECLLNTTKNLKNVVQFFPVSEQ